MSSFMMPKIPLACIVLFIRSLIYSGDWRLDLAESGILENRKKTIDFPALLRWQAKGIK
jgi:hypothetical protein